MREILILSILARGITSQDLQPRKDGPSHLQFMSITDQSGTAEFFYSNTVDQSCISGSDAICRADCGFITDKSDYYSQIKCRFCLIRWKCLDLKSFRTCGRARCSDQCVDESTAGPKEFYGLASTWREQECLACMLKEECATEFDLRLHYGFTRNCVGECVSKESDSCPPLPVAERCSYRCHQQCDDSNDQNCFADCLKVDECAGMQPKCVNCIESCAATKIVVQESGDRSIFDAPRLKAHFTSDYIKANQLDSAPSSSGQFGREREETEKEKGAKKSSRRDRRKNRRNNNKRGFQKKSRKRQKNGKILRRRQ